MDQLTDDQINIIVEALLFGSCLEITDSWSNVDRDNMIQLAKQIARPSTSLSNIQLHHISHDMPCYIADALISTFPHINVISEPSHI